MNFTQSIQQNGLSALIFWSIFLTSIFFANIYQKKRLKYDELGNVHIRPISRVDKFVWTILIILGPSLIIGFRHYTVGADTSNLVTSYSRLASPYTEIFMPDRPLYSLIRYATFTISNGNPTFFLMSLVIPTLYIFVRALDKWIDKISLPLALFIYYAYFGMILLDQARQLLALSILFYSIYYLLDRKYFKYYLCIMIATSIHFTALFGIIFHLLYFQPTRVYSVKKWFFYLLWILSPFLIVPILMLLNQFIPSTYRGYLEIASYDGIGFGLVLTILPIIIPILFFRKYLRGYENGYLVRIALLAFPLRFAGYVSFFLMRLHYYSSVFIVLIIPLAIHNMKSKIRRRRAVFLIIVIFLIYYIVTYIYIDDGRVFPYISIFNR